MARNLFDFGITKNTTIFKRFTEEEAEAIMAASVEDAKVKLFLFRLILHPMINDEDTRIITLVEHLETAEIIGAGRAKQILEEDDKEGEKEESNFMDTISDMFKNIMT